MQNLHDPVDRPVRGAPLDGGRRRALDKLLRRAVAVIAEEHATPWRQGHVFIQPCPAGPKDKRRDQIIYYCYKAARAGGGPGPGEAKGPSIQRA